MPQDADHHPPPANPLPEPSVPPAALSPGGLPPPEGGQEDNMVPVGIRELDFLSFQAGIGFWCMMHNPPIFLQAHSLYGHFQQQDHHKKGKMKVTQEMWDSWASKQDWYDAYKKRLPT